MVEIGCRQIKTFTDVETVAKLIAEYKQLITQQQSLNDIVALNAVTNNGNTVRLYLTDDTPALLKSLIEIRISTLKRLFIEYDIRNDVK